MQTFIEVTEGVNSGSRYKIKDGMTIGRTTADIIIPDPKISGTHAQITLDGRGQLVLVDLDSSNGIHINGRRVKKVALLSGVSFEVGRTQFRVVTVEEETAKIIERQLTWREVLKEGLASINDQAPKGPIKLGSLSPALKLTFIQGIQTDQEIILGYGPRRAGLNNLDIDLLDPKAPKEAFEFHPGPGMVELRIPTPGKALLNGQALKSAMLKDGDLISFGNTLIRITYL